MVGHPVLDAAGHIHVLGFGVDDALAAVESKVDREQRSVADQSLETFEALGIGINCRFCNCHWPSLPSGQTYEGIGITVQTPGRRTNGRVWQVRLVYCGNSRGPARKIAQTRILVEHG